MENLSPNQALKQATKLIKTYYLTNIYLAKLRGFSINY